MKTSFLTLGVSALALVLFLAVSCNGDADVELASFNTPGDLMTPYGKDLPISFNIPEGLTKVELIYNDSVLKTYSGEKGKQSFTLDADYCGVGARNLVLRSHYADGTAQETTMMVLVVSDVTPKKLRAAIVNTLPHNKLNYTQGLEFSNGELFEGTGDPGQQGKTMLGKVNMATGEYTAFKGLDATYFGEGITIMGDQIYQLTWQSGKCFLYNKNDLNMKLKEFNYSGEGWGLCNDGKQLIMSNGTEYLTFRDPKTFMVTRTIQVVDKEMPRVNLNELEYIDGKIYANIYTTNTVIAIDPATGRVLEEIDAADLAVLGKGTTGDVLNGIAYNQAAKKLYMTGKYWEKLFEVKLVP